MFKLPKKLTTLSAKHHIELRALQIAIAVVAGLLLATTLVLWQTHQDAVRNTALQSQAQEFKTDQAVPPTGLKIGGPFTLMNQDGKTVSDADFHGKYMLIYFGYTYCPDMCPTGLQGIAHIMDQLGNDAGKVQPLFITIDPARDTPEKLKEYIASFHPTIQGLTGTPAQIAAVAKEYQVYYAKGEQVDENDYLMDHSSLIYLMDPQGKFIATFDESADPAKIVVALHKAGVVSPPTNLAQ